MIRRLALVALAFLTVFGGVASTIAPAVVPESPLEAPFESTILREGITGQVQPGSDDPLALPADFEGSPPGQDGTPPAPSEGGMLQGPYGRLVRGLLEEENRDPARHVQRVQDYYAEMGFPVPHSSAYEAPSPTNDGTKFEENNTISFTHELGDVDGDGVDDIALDMYCVSWECYPYVLSQFPPQVNIERTDQCGTAHRVLALSGATGTPLWNRTLGIKQRSLAQPTSMIEPCLREMVVGTVPLPEGRNGLLVYAYGMIAVADPFFGNAYFEITNVHYLVDGTNGKTLWSLEEKGRVVIVGLATCSLPTLFNFVCYKIHAENLLVNPILQINNPRRLPTLPAGTESALFQQGVGFDYTYGHLRAAPPGETVGQQIFDEYQPIEWAKRVEFLKGKTVWGPTTTFSARADRSVWPNILQLPSITGQPEPVFVGMNYWSGVPCCFDNNGDKQPDLLYTTIEWSPTPFMNTQGPYHLASRIHLRDGAKGTIVFDKYVEEGTQRFVEEEYDAITAFWPSFQVLGDANGDGASDILLHLEYFLEDYVHVVSVRNGKDGSELWRLNSPRDLRALILGDATGDGSNDLLLLDWFNWEFPFRKTYHYANVTKTHLSVFNGRDGQKLWDAVTFNAPVDLDVIYDSFSTNGMPDFDQDGVRDVPVDDPLYLEDLTVVHRHTYLSGRTGLPMFKFLNVGTFSFPALAGDVNGDGVDDFSTLSGDITDLWITVYDGSTGQAAWSRRMMTLRVSDYYSGIPRLRYHFIHNQDTPAQDLIINFHLSLQTRGGYWRVSSNYPQLTAYESNGTVVWAIPRIWDADLYVIVLGASPAVQQFEAALAKKLETPSRTPSIATEALKAAPPIGSFALALGAGFGLVQWRRKP